MNDLEWSRPMQRLASRWNRSEKLLEGTNVWESWSCGTEERCETVQEGSGWLAHLQVFVFSGDSVG